MTDAIRVDMFENHEEAVKFLIEQYDDPVVNTVVREQQERNDAMRRENSFLCKRIEGLTNSLFNEYTFVGKANKQISGRVTEWQPISSAPKDTRNKVVFILITDGFCVPDLVVWLDKVPEKIINGNRNMSIPPGWFNIDGGRSRLDRIATHWHPLPDWHKLRDGYEDREGKVE
jgi:hypothetical protein